MQFLTSSDVKNMLLAACRKIIAHKQVINSINVFPVADQDTGNNLSRTLKGIEDTLKKSDAQSFDSLAHEILNSALLSAQGNSGMILTGFFQGFFQPVRQKQTINAYDVAKALENAFNSSKDAIENPVKGTVLDVIETTAVTANRFVETGEQDLAMIFDHCVKEAHRSLQETTGKMDILKRSGVVDAGGLGFVMLLESFYEYVSGKTLPDSGQKYQYHLKTDGLMQNQKHPIEIISIIEGCAVESEQLKEMMAAVGDSIDIVTAENKMKLHVHTDQPHTVKEIIESLGSISYLQIVDMITEKVIESFDNSTVNT